LSGSPGPTLLFLIFAGVVVVSDVSSNFSGRMREKIFFVEDRRGKERWTSNTRCTTLLSMSNSLMVALRFGYDLRTFHDWKVMRMGKGEGKS